VRKFRLSTLRRFVLLLLLLIVGLIVYRWISLERWRWRLMQLTGPESEWAIPIRPTPSPKPARPPVITGRLEVPRLFNGITLHSEIATTSGGAASDERLDPQSYVVDLTLTARVPTPNKTIDDLARVNPDLPHLLPGLAMMISPDSVSPFFAKLYEAKVKALREHLGRLDQLLSRHNFYDCQTVLELEHPQTHRKAVLMQAEMDVDADGSDSDRLPISMGAPANFKATTSFHWPKKTKAPNPYLAATQARLDRVEDELAQKSTTADRKRELRDARTQLRLEIDTLKKFSFLIGTTDPYIVIPTGFAPATGAKIGDYALVISGAEIYPAIVGDAGPPDKVGEASLRIAKEINPLSTPYSRPVSDLKVTYLIFPGTADARWGPPDLEKLQKRCEELVNDIGGTTSPLHHWSNIIPPPPTPTPTPTPTLTPSISPTASPSATFAFPVPSITPTVSPSATMSGSPDSNP
jgi:glycosyl hydrolase group 75 (putative chitosanase)